MESLNSTLRDSGPFKAELETFSCKRGLRAWFEKDSIACYDSWNDRVDGREIREIPRGDDKDDPLRYSFDISLEARLIGVLERDVRKALFGDGQHIFSPLNCPSQLANALRHRSACQIVSRIDG